MTVPARDERASTVVPGDLEPLPLLLIPGAWMGGWIWDETIERLERHGCRARTLTLPGLEAGATASDLAAVGLMDHVDEAMRAVAAFEGPLVVVGHSYSGLIAGMVADRLPDQIVHTVIVCGFFARDGHCLLDDWGSDNDERAQERAAIERADMVWEPPPIEGIEADPGLSDHQAAALGRRLVPHPGRTILDVVSMQRPVTEQSVTVIANVSEGDPRSTLPDDLAGARLDRWTFRSIPAGHWPMLSCPDQLDAALLSAATSDAR